MKEALLVFAGGGAGSVLRYWISLAIRAQFGWQFPWATLTVNVVGCFLLGFLLSTLGCGGEPSKGYWRLLLGIGFCGGFTTFSAFAHENMRLLQTQPTQAFLYIGASLFFGIAAVGVGAFLAGLWG